MLGFLAGLLSGPLGLVIAYLIGVLLTAYKTREVLATLLVAGTVLPLMLLLVLAIPTMMISILSGLAIALSSKVISRSVLLGGTVGVILGEIVLTRLLPLVVVPHPDDFTSIITNPVLSGSYGLLLGVLTGTFFKLFTKWNT